MIRSCADKLGSGRERDTVQRTANRYDDDGDGTHVGLRLPPLAAVMMAARALPPQTDRRRTTTKKRGAGRKYSCVVQGCGALDCVLSTYQLHVNT